MKKICTLLLALCALWILPAVAGERTDLIFTNRLDEEIVVVRVKYATPYDEPRHHSSHVNLPPGAEDWRLGVQGTTLPEAIIFDLATKSYVFDDLADLEPTNEMFLEVKYENGKPILGRTDGDGGDGGEIAGTAREYLTDANSPNAVDRDFLTDVKTWEELGELVRETMADAHGGEEELTSSDIEEFVFTEDDGWGETAYFPVRWMDWTGVARVSAIDEEDEDEGIGFDLRFELPEGGHEKIAEMADSLMSDLRVDGFRPWHFAMETWNEEKGESDVTDLVFHEGDGDKYDDQDAMQERLFAAYADGSLSEASVTWVKEETFDAAKAGEEPPAAPGVMVMFSKATFEALFVPDGRMFFMQ